MINLFKSKKELKKQINDAEYRALTHFKKIFQIQQIIKEADKNKELYVITIDKIKKII